MNTQRKIVLGVVIVLVIAAAGWYWWHQQQQAKQIPNALDSFAQCIKDSGTKFYGAFWCPHCQAQKQLFGPSVKYLPYIECSNPDGQTQTAVCINEKITSYPTWVWPDHATSTGEQSLQVLAQKTGCTLPVTP